MADEPNNGMDEALKAYARKRRQEAPSLEMHSATRQMLQAEVARAHRSSRSGQQSAWLSFLPRLGFAFSIVIVLAVVFWSTRSPSPRVELSAQFEPIAPDAVPQAAQEKDVALNDAASREEQTLRAKSSEAEARLRRQLDEGLADRAATPMPLIVAANKAVADQDMLKEKNEVAARADASGVRETAPPAAVPTLVQVEQSDFTRKLNAGQQTADAAVFYRIGGVDGAISTNAVLGLAQRRIAPASETSARASTETTLAVAARSQVMRFQSAAPADSEYRDRFRRTDSRSQAARLMETFELQQAGNEVRVVDQDGSVYNGVVTPQADLGWLYRDALAEQAKRTYAEAEKQDAARALRTPVATTNRARLAFTVSGTNRTLNQPVSLDGALVPEPAAVSLTAPSRPQAAAQELRKPASAPSTGEVLRFRGQLRLGRTNQIAIDALRVSP